jgi:hypothetical protein
MSCLTGYFAASLRTRCNYECFKEPNAFCVLCKLLFKSVTSSRIRRRQNMFLFLVCLVHWFTIFTQYDDWWQTCQVSRFNGETHDFWCFLTISWLSPQISRFSAKSLLKNMLLFRETWHWKLLSTEAIKKKQPFNKPCITVCRLYPKIEYLLIIF